MGIRSWLMALCLLAQPQHLKEQTGQGSKVTAPEIADPAVVRLPVAGQNAHGVVLPAGLSLP
jgi:hypothetical protein